ncbi:hypothetical protein [Bradyrhizobium septentrionale]|uniref:HTH marR-type domain-containing protein n=1 Tax=Bradyrhizobium septentrionale TaxID=1404411 RepID=A0ABZ2PCF7_9BRAD
MTLDTPAPQPPEDGLWLSVSEIAERKGVSKQAVSARIAPLIADGRLTVRPGKGNAKLINLAQYDLAIGQVGNAAREAGAATARAATLPARGQSSARFRDEQTREKAYAADLKFIELERARGNLISLHDIDEVIEETARRLVEVFDGLIGHAENLTAIGIRDGQRGMHLELKRIVRGQRETAVQAIKDMAAASKARAKNQASAEFPSASTTEGD